MKKLLSELGEFWRSRIYAVILSLTAAGAYGFAVTHSAIGMDDTAISLYFDEGLAPYVGRWTLFVLNKLFHIHIGEYAPYLTELLSVVLLLLSVTLWCVLWRRVCEPRVKLPMWAYAVTAGLFLSCPLISEVFVFYLHNGVCTGYGVTALALLCLLDSLAVQGGRKETVRGTLLSGLLLCVALGFYESFVIVYAMGAVMVFLLIRILYGKRGEGAAYRTGFLAWAGRGASALAAALLGRTVMLAVLKLTFSLERLSIYNVQYRSFFGDIFTKENELQMVLKRFFMKYYVNALTYFPITVLVAALAVIGLALVCISIRKKDAMLVAGYLAILLLPVAMSLLEGLATRYRSAQYVPLVSAYAALLVFLFLYSCKPLPALIGVCGALLAILLVNQCVEMNRWFYVDELKYEDTRRVMEQIAYDLETTADLSKPVVFRGAYRVPYEIAKEAYVGFDTWQYRAVCRITDSIDEHLKEKYYAADAPAYVSAEMPLVSTLQWGVTAFDGTCGQLIAFWRMHGIGGIQCVTDLAVIEEAEQLRSSVNMPAYPQEGYIRDCGDYLIINMSNE